MHVLHGDTDKDFVQVVLNVNYVHESNVYYEIMQLCFARFNIYNLHLPKPVLSLTQSSTRFLPLTAAQPRITPSVPCW